MGTFPLWFSLIANQTCLWLLPAVLSLLLQAQPSLDLPSLALQAEGSGHMKPIFTLSQAATFLVCLVSSTDVVADSLQVTVIHLPMLHHLNKVIEMIPGVRQDSHLPGISQGPRRSAELHPAGTPGSEAGIAWRGLSVVSECGYGHRWYKKLRISFSQRHLTNRTAFLSMSLNIYSFYICEMFQTFISKIAGTEWVALAAKGKISKSPKKWFIGCKSLTIMNVILLNKFFIVIT